ncbi:AzlC family ABC transporter permease [uncultured Phascolarctobacterium sp.]|uniref:AzlC family ABC transporter permease n=1 Tax=uncultured Phascolarctobacterium sp. TaxID=512296 RepID=UPI002624E755|nr:AzlC family ABC transporter permease [uncultured Phascolarctobacterium sp.]
MTSTKQQSSPLPPTKSEALRQGAHDAIPIGLGYFAVAFSLGIICRSSGLSVFQGFLASLLNNTSAGEFAAITLIGTNASYMEIALVTLIANARYMLMSCALSQRLEPGKSFLHRLGIAFAVTDELFGIAIARKGYLEPAYYYGAMAVAIPGWSLGTACGIIAGSALPERIVSALSVALFGMFLAIIIPPARESRVILTVVLTSFIASFVATYVEPLAQLTGGTRTIILTVAIAAGAAWFSPVSDQRKEG